MKHWRVGLVALALVVALAAPEPASSAAPAPGATYSNPLYDKDFADPFVIRDGGAYYSYATNGGDGSGPDSVFNVQVLRSDDLAHWERTAQDALPTANLGSWVDRSRLPGRIWAPGVLERWYGAPYWVLYYTAPALGSYQCIGVAVATHPAGPFRDSYDEPMICQHDKFGSIDASPFLPPGGSGRNPAAMLTWKSENNIPRQDTELWVQALDASGTSMAPGRPSLLLRGDQSIPWEVSEIERGFALIEGHTVRWDPRSDRYVVLYSAGFIYGDAPIGYATCESRRGLPVRCRRPASAASGPWLRGVPGADGPGGPELFSDEDGYLWMAYHARPATPTFQGRWLRVDKFCFGRGGMPRTNAPTNGVAVPLHRERRCAEDIAVDRWGRP